MQIDITLKEIGMNSKLRYIRNWSELAKQANWSASKLAKKCDVSVRTLERFYLKQFGRCPKTWLAEQRQALAIEFLRDGRSVKETATRLGYGHASTFSREYKKQSGNRPTTQLADLWPFQP